MYRNHPIAERAPIFFRLALQERFHTDCFQFFKVFNHAHVISFTVTFVQMNQVLARYGIALAAGLDLMRRELFAATFYVAILSSRKTAYTVCHFSPLLRDIMNVCIVGFAYPTVHAAWSNEFRSKGGLIHRFILAGKIYVVYDEAPVLG